MKRSLAALAALAALLLLATPSHAGEWRQRRVTFSAPAGWEALTDQVLSDWSSCGVLSLSRVTSKEDVPIVVEDYGYTLWAGQGTQIINSRGRVIGGRVLINQWWLDNGLEPYKQFLLCHEIGHTLGVPHINVVDTCMMQHGISPVPGSSGCAALQSLYAR